MRRLVCAAFLASLMISALPARRATAYEEYAPSPGAGCETCHGVFLAAPYTGRSDGQVWNDGLHAVHQQMVSFDCATCHRGAPGGLYCQGGANAGASCTGAGDCLGGVCGKNRVRTNLSSGGTGLDPIGCIGCHGRSGDRFQSVPKIAGDGAGLRQHHWASGITECFLCHDDSPPTAYTPVAENVLPPFYPTPDAAHPNKPTNPCNPFGEEDFAGSFLGLDNDGDGLYDSADPNCPPPATPTPTPAPTATPTPGVTATPAPSATPTAVPSPPGANKCLAGKTDCVSKKAAGLLNCHVRAELGGLALDPACVTRAKAKFDGNLLVPPDPAKGCFEKLEGKEDASKPATLCITHDDTATMEEKVDAFVLDVVTDVDPGYPTAVTSACSAAKKKCVLKKAAALLKCRQKCQKDPIQCGAPKETDCEAKAKAKFDGGGDDTKSCFAKAEKKADCLTPGGIPERDAMEAKVDAFVTDMANELEGLPSSLPSFLVKDTTGAVVEGATVYAIPASDVEELASQPLTLTAGNYDASALAVDEPLEDLINGNFTPASGGVATYPSGVTDADGRVEIANLPTDATPVFLYVHPAAGDTGHLPGGSRSRQAISGQSLDGKKTEIEISTRPSASATFIGSSACLGCHPTYSTETQILHKLGIMVPGAPSALQDPTEFDEDDGIYNIGAGVAKFTAGDSTSGGTTVYFSDYDGTRSFDKFKTQESPPPGTVYGTVRAYRDTVDNRYKMEFTNVINPDDPNSPMTLPMELTYGGGAYKQRYMTTLAGKDSVYMLPLQFHATGRESSSDRTRKVWRDYHFDWWWNINTTTPSLSTFKTAPSASNSFDIQCATCHYTGYSVTQDADGEYVARAVADSNGEAHPLAGTNLELNIGCESCHGPGSEHLAAGGRGAAIVTPANLTPERASMICGQCHSRPKGKDSFGLKSDSPLDQQDKMMLAGTSRAEFLANNTTRHDATTSDFWADGKHSKSHHQQYTDFIRSRMYRNGETLLTCASCHDPHAPGSDRHQLSGTADNSLCTSCHPEIALEAHMTEKVGFSMGATSVCIQCHSPKTAKTGAGNPNPTLIGASGTKYFKNDISSHHFDVPLKSSVSPTNAMPIPYTDPCGVCHAGGTLP